MLEAVRITLDQLQGTSQPDVRVNTNPVTAFIRANDPIVVSISPPADSSGNPLDPVVEGDTTGAYSVSIDKIPTADLTVDYATSDLTAVAGSDYTSATGTLTFTQADGLSAQSITIDTIEDQLNEGSESFRLALSNLQGGGGPASTLAATSSLDVEIDDDDLAAISIQTYHGQVDEGGAAQFRVTLSKTVNADVTVNWSAAGADPGDYSPTSGSVTFPASSTAMSVMTIAIDIADDSLTEPAEMFTVTLDGFSSALASGISILGSANSADATIGESDPITVSLNGPSQVQVNGQAEYSVSLNNFPAEDLTVNYLTTDGTAAAGTDYTAAVGLLTFARGETAKTVSVPVGSSGAGKDFSFSILTPRGGGGPAPQLDTPSTITTTIAGGSVTPVAPKRFTLSAVPSSVAEDAGATSVTVTATLDSSQTLGSAVQINVGAHGGGTADEGTDYTFVPTSGSVMTVGAGATSSSVSYTLTPVDDGVTEGDETIVVRGASSDNLEMVDGSITLTDSAQQTQPIRTIALSVSPSSLSESATTTDVAVMATLSGSGTLLTSTVVTLTLGGSAGSSDYTAGSLTSITIAAGQSSGTGTLAVTPTDDTLIEGDETIVVTGTATGLTVSDATITITDDDGTPTGITLGVSPVTIAESAATTTVTVTATLNGASTLPTNTLVTLTLGGTATQNTDYAVTPLTSVTIPAGQSVATTTLTISPTDDSAVEGDETIVVSGTVTGFTVSDATITITDDDGAPTALTLSVNPDTVGESAATTTATVTATLNGTSTLPTNTLVTLTLGGTATQNTDYAASALTSVTIPAGQSNARATLTITPTDDSVVEGDETIVVSGTAPDLTVSDATVTITDDDTAELSVAGPTAQVVEGNNAAFTVTLSEAVSDAVSVAWSVTPGTASASDYGTSAGTVTFGAGSVAGATQAITIGVTDDALSEPSEKFTVTLGAVTSALSSRATVRTASSSADAVISESDPITVNLSGPSGVDEGDATGTYTVSLSPTGVAPTADLTVDYATSDGTATAGEDYAAKSGTLTFTQANHADKTFAVQTTEDTVSEGDETFTLAISSPSGGGGPTPTLGTSTAETTITDDDGAPTGITLSVSPDSVTESAATTTVTVTARLNGTSTLPSATNVTLTLGGTATQNTDYTAANSLPTLTISAGDRSGSATLAITPTNDSVVEVDETIVVSGSAQGLTGSSDTVTITDDEVRS